MFTIVGNSFGVRLGITLILIVGMLEIQPPTSVLAATLTVTNTNDSGAGSLRQAITDSASGGVIRFSPSLAGQTIMLSSELTINKDLIIDGSSLTSNITLDGSSSLQVLIIIQNNPIVMISNLDFRNAVYGIFSSSSILSVMGSSFSGIVTAGIFNEIELTITNSSFSENGDGIVNFGVLHVDSSTFAMNRRGIYNEKVSSPFTTLGDATITNCIFSQNHQGGIQNRNGTLNITDSSFVGNESEHGGGIQGGAATILDSLFENNHASGYGGAINGSPLIIMNSVFLNNIAGIDGGAIFGDGEITDSTFIGNMADNAGGGISGMFQLLLSNSTFYNNSATTDGGAIYHHQSTTLAVSEVTNSTFFENSAGGKGGGIFNDGDLLLVNNTFSNNSGNSGGNIYNANGRYYAGVYKLSDLQLRNTILANSTLGGDCYNETDTVIDAANNLIENNSSTPNNCSTPLISSDPLLGPLAYNGGPTQMLALLSDSPAINAGNDASCPATDQRGVARPQGSHCDIGAYEYQIATCIFADVPCDY